MKATIRVGCVVIACALLPIEPVLAQSAASGCSSGYSANGTQTLHCESGLTIVAESGARYTLRHRAGRGGVSSVELEGKALLLELPKQSGGNSFQVITPQAIAAVRGTKWAVDAADSKTSVFVVRGKVVVTQRAGVSRVTLGPGDGVDVEAAAGPLTVKRWPPERVAALMARLGQ